MKILQIGNFGIKRNLSHFYNIDYKLYFGLVKNGHAVYQFSNRDIARQESITKSRFGSKGKVNKKLIKVCSNLKPDMILIGHAEQITNDSLNYIKQENPDIRIAYFNVDALWVDHNKKLIEDRLKCESLDGFFVTTAGDAINEFRRDGLKVSFIPNATDRSIDKYRCFENEASEYDIFFAGSGEYRTQAISYLRDRLPHLNYNILAQNNRPLLYGQDYYDELVKCKIGLNLPQFTEDHYQPYLYSSDRISQYMGNGLLTFIHRKTGYEEYFAEGKEALYYDNCEELAEKINHYNMDKKAARDIAGNGWQKYHMLFSSEKISQYIVEEVFDLSHSHNYGWPIK